MPLSEGRFLLAPISYFTTRIGSTCTNRSARRISWREEKETKEKTHTYARFSAAAQNGASGPLGLSEGQISKNNFKIN
jgi:hypothetical protein